MFYIVRNTDDEPESYGRFDDADAVRREIDDLGIDAAEDWLLVEMHIDGGLSFHSLYEWLDEVK